MKYLVVIPDGMADVPVEALGNKTPMEAADKPTMDALARVSTVGRVLNVPHGMVPESDTANMAILSFDPKVYSRGPVLLALADSVTARIRSDGAKAYCVAVTIRDNSFKTRSHQRSLMNPTDISKEVYQICKELFYELWDGVTPLRLLGIAMTNITREETVQFSLFQDEAYLSSSFSSCSS